MFYHPTRDRNAILRLEVKRFDDPMSKTLLNYLTSKHGREYFFVVDLSGDFDLNGYILAGLQDASNLYIFSLAVDKTYENQGWGSKLLELVISKATKKNISKITLHVERENLKALRLYEKFGFQTISLVNHYYGSGRHAIFMELDLNLKVK